ncbi:MAG: rhomboid family intramembrane serine protease [Acidimicrobiales bacterium]
MAPSPEPQPGLRIGTALQLLVAAVAVMWAVEIVDTLLLGSRLQANGIQPREAGGLDGILWAPWLHGSFGHLLSNTVPFVVLGGLVALRGLDRLLSVTAIVIVVGGGLTWLFAGSGNHLGASGIVFGYFGALIGSAIWERRLATLAAVLVALMLYSGMVVGLVPQERISWEGHLFGLLAGLLAARLLARPPEPPVDVPEPWEADRPWLEP